MSWLAVVMVVGGMAVLVAGASALVLGAARLAAAAGISSLVIGLTVVAFGTSAPELAVSVQAALTGAGEVAIGNAVGSNIFNTLAILGVSALFGGLVVHQRLVRVDVPIVLVVTAVTWWMTANGHLGRGEGALLAAGVVAYTLFAYLLGRREPKEVVAEYDEAFGAGAPPPRRWLGAVGLVIGGLVALVAGAQLLVNGATELASTLGVSDLIIGLTVVAAGTSLPELATSVVATRRGERDIAVGNIVGSNLFNLLAVLGLSALAGGGLPVPDATIATDVPVLLLATLVALPALALGLSVTRWEGAVLLAGYVGYIAYLVLDGLGSAAAPEARVWLLGAFAAAAVLVTGIGLAIAARTRRPTPGRMNRG